jgi:hypothetical protein
MVWTVLTYNPVRILGAIGMVGVAIAGLVGLVLVAARLSGITTLNAWGVAAVYLALVSAVAGISIFALGSTFNYLVSLFYKRPIRQGLFGRPCLPRRSTTISAGWVRAAGWSVFWRLPVFTSAERQIATCIVPWERHVHPGRDPAGDLLDLDASVGRIEPARGADEEGFGSCELGIAD